MNIGDDVVNISDVPPLALLDLAGKIMTAKKLHSECLGELYARYRVLLKQIREEKDITIKELSALCGSSSDFLQAAESGSLEVTDDNLKSVQDVYWTVATGEEHPGDFKRLANERLATPYPDFGSPMREIREQKELTIEELSTLSGVPADILEKAESGELEMTDEDSREVRRVYWSLSALEASPGDYRRLLADIPMKANAD